MHVTRDARQYLLAEAALCRCLEMLVSISLRGRRSGCEWRCSSDSLSRGSAPHVNRDARPNLCAEAAL
jgi:predicted nucleic acid-binding Zn finger protein